MPILNGNGSKFIGNLQFEFLIIFPLRKVQEEKAAVAAEVAVQERRLEEARARRALRDAGRGQPQ